MKRNLIVLGGVAVLIVAGYFVPMLSFPEKKWYMQAMETVRVTSRTSAGMGLIILWFMQTNSKWRGVLWIVLSLLGSILTINEVQQRYEFFVNLGLRGDPNYLSGNLSYEIGFYLIIFGYIIVMLGSAWDIVQKRRQEKLGIFPEKIPSS